MPAGFLALPIRRPMATAMLFLALVLLGVFAWYRIPVELMPALSGEHLFVRFNRPGSDPEVVEREILLPLEARSGELAGLRETWGEVRGDGGSLELEFRPGSNIRTRELELRRIAADLNRSQPEGSFINVSSRDLTALSRFAMVIQVLGGEDSNALRDLVDERIQPRLATLSGVSQVIASGGMSREVTVWVDPDRCAALGIRASQVTESLGRSVRRLRYLGGTEAHGRRLEVILDGRPQGIISLGEIRIDPERPVRLRHVADIDMGTARQENLFRINGQAAIGLLVFQDEGANLVQLGRALRERIELLRAEFNPYGIDFRIGFDAAETVEDQLDRLKQLAIWGFAIALIVLFLFLRDLRAVAVVAVAVPVSLLVAGALLYLGGYTLNLITLLGLVIGIGMLVDNSVVVFESVQRFLERGLAPDDAAIAGARRTVRAIITASATNAIVFLPAIFIVDDPMLQETLVLVAVAILLPLAASLLVAIGLVPLLARRLAAPAALARMRQIAQRRRNGEAGPPQHSRELFSALLKVALRRPVPWLAGVTGAVLLTIIVAVPWVLVSTLAQQNDEASEVRLQIEMAGGRSLEAAADVFNRMEQAVLALDGIDMVESYIQENEGTLTIQLDDEDTSSGRTTAGKVQRVVRDAVADINGVTVKEMGIAGNDNGGGTAGGGLFGDTASQVLVSGPEMSQLRQLASEIQSRLESVPEIEDAWISGQEGMEELHIRPVPSALAMHRLNPENVLQTLNVFRREGVQLQVGFTLADGRELPLTVRRLQYTGLQARQQIESLRLAMPDSTLVLGELATVQKRLPPPVISHHNGRRELTVNYLLGNNTPEAGPERMRLEERIQELVRSAYRPPGYTVAAPGMEESENWLSRLLVPVLLMLYAVLAVAFESLTLPVLVLVAVPLTVLGATWALLIAGTGAGIVALVGVIALLGMTVNPAILLVDRMQQRLLKTGCSGGTAAVGAVRERTRPVLMTSCTTIAGLWPLALTTGDTFEIWPPFATVVMGGLATSTLLTLLVIPVGFVLLARLDRIFGRLGPWVTLGWIGTTAAVMTPLILGDQINALNWQVTTTLLVAGVLFVIILRLFRERPILQLADSGMVVEARYLQKVYNKPGPVLKAWQAAADRGQPYRRPGRDTARDRILTFGLLLAGAAYLAINLQTRIWQLLFCFLCAAFFSRLVIALRDFIRAPTVPAAVDSHVNWQVPRVKILSPWLVLLLLLVFYTLLPWQTGEPQRLPPVAIALLALVTLVFQAGRMTAVKTANGILSTRPGLDDVSRWRKAWRYFALTVFGFDLPREQIDALGPIHFRAEQGMIGILGPNGAGKTTLLRLLAGVLDPTLGTIHYGGLLKQDAGPYLSKWIGYLPQEFGLPDHLTAQEYLDYYALLYDVGDWQTRRQRVDELLREVGLSDRRHERIGGYSGGMRQRVAVARTLLRQPPVIIVDEPTVGLDPRERIRFRNLLSGLAVGRVVLFSTHVVEDVAVSCQRVIVLSKGRINYDGQPAGLAQVAAGRVWEVLVQPGSEIDLNDGSKVVNQAPDADGGSRLRVLCPQPPHAGARPLEPGIEDGYLYLVNQ